MNRCTTTCSMICSAIEVGSQSLQQRLALPGSRLLLRGTAMTFGAKTGSPSDSFSYDFIWFHMISWSESRRNHMISSIYICINKNKYIYIINIISISLNIIHQSIVNLVPPRAGVEVDDLVLFHFFDGEPLSAHMTHSYPFLVMKSLWRFVRLELQFTGGCCLWLREQSALRDLYQLP
jgi:hypothetical protein